jgi:hypothetical protein
MEKTESRHNEPNRRYKVTTIQGSLIDEQILTRQQLACLDSNDIDVVIDEPRRKVSIKLRGHHGSAPCRPRRVSGLGVYGWKLLTDAFFLGGEVLELKSTGWTNARVRRLRRAFGDTKASERFFKTTSLPYGIAINTDQKWRFIEALAQ